MKTVHKIIYSLYSLIDNIRYLFFGARNKLNKPLILYPKEIRLFLSEYGQNGNHYSFNTSNKEKQLSFLINYYHYLKFNHPNRVFNFNGDYIETENDINYVKIFFYNNKPVYKCEGKNKSRAEGHISLTLEYGIL